MTRTLALLFTLQAVTAHAVRPMGDRPVILLLGDSNIFGPLGKVLQEQLEDAGFFVKRKAKPGSGLAFPRFHDWLAKAPSLADRYHADVVVIMFGGNDGQSLKPAGPDSPPIRIPWEAESEWSEEYSRRIRRLATSLTRRGRQLVVLSPTNRRSPKAVSRMQRVVQLQRAALSMPGATWIDTWSLSSNRERAWLSHGPSCPSPSCSTVKYRKRDGIHLTLAGAQALARRLLPQIQLAMGRYPNSQALAEDPM